MSRLDGAGTCTVGCSGTREGGGCAVGVLPLVPLGSGGGVGGGEVSEG